ncbi:MAG: hypothetical protein LBE18_07290, partial [Planctomycetaceae bacterium]|nr:hypothetical protein [Planctomycetaceae bacterium]
MKNLLNEKKVNRIDRGITLLLVLAMMTLFSVLIISFMLITSAAKNMAVNQARVLLDPKDRSTENAKKESASAIGTILFGDNNSVFGSLSILENLYGNRPIRRTMGNFGISPTSNDLRRIYWADEPTRLQLGHVLTITNFNYTGSISNAQQVIIDKYKNQSRLIKNFGTDGNGNYIEVEKFSDNDVSEIQLLGSISGSTWEFIINSPAFSGTGEGFVYTPPNTPAISDMSNLASIPRVFLPNVEGYGNNTMMNPDYTAPDHLNWFLAWYDINAAGGISDGDIIPSFHRPKLIKHLYDSGLLSSPALLEAATLRPLPTRHPKFTGSNATATNATATSLINFLTHGSGAEWDVDNDGDGIKDSIWIDIDLPTFEDRSRSGPAIKVKPLIAVLIRDLDGLINVNAHGNVTHYDSPASPSSIKTISGVSEEGEFGSGMGPAEVKLNVLDNVLSQTLIGRRRIASGSSEVPAGVNAANYASYPDNVGLGRLYPDFWGYAQVIFEPMGYRFFDLAMYNYPLYQNNPYMTDVYRNKGNPFSVAELEPFIRSKNDIDSYQFAETLKDIFGGYENNNFKNNRYLITTHSSSIPAMSKSGGSDSTGNFFNLRERINRYTIYDVNCQTIIKNLPPEIIRGEKINLNKVANLSTAEKSEFAHQLFLLLMVLCHDKIKDNVSYNENPAVTGGQPLTSEQMITRLAQWSVNVVDFIDADAAMTPLAFSIKPFADMKIYDLNGNYKNPINVTDFPAYQDIRIVFGKEDNDLFITKTFATHNRNTADSKQDNPTEDTTTNKPKGYVNSNTNHDQ